MKYFDDSLPYFTSLLTEELGTDVVTNGVFSRDTSGRLAFFCSKKLTKKVISQISRRVISELAPYARSDRPIADISDFGVVELLLEQALSVKVGSIYIKLLDRRIVGGDWLRPPAAVDSTPPRFVFASIKGGVGRTTALSIVAADLAARGKSILIVDLDLEAPGIGSMLLEENTNPEFGMIDALVEINLNKLSDSFIADLIGPSALSDRSGKIDVIPAFGRRSLENPHDILAKISRAYSDRIDDTGKVSTFLDKVHEIIEHVSKFRRYDVILVDARAGLHETTASALLGIGAHLLFFGLNEPQTFQGYNALFSNLIQINSIKTARSSWLATVSMVQGKAPLMEDERNLFAINCEELFVKTGFISLPVKSKSVPLPAHPFRDVPWKNDEDVLDEELDESKNLPDILHVLFDEKFFLFNPNERKHLMTSEHYKFGYGALIDKIYAELSIHGGEES